MTIDQLKDQIPDFARDVRLNLASMMADDTLSLQSNTAYCWRARSRPIIHW